MKTVDLFNLYMGDSRPGPSWSESSIGCVKVRLSDDYNDKVSQLPQPPMWTLNETGLQRSPAQEGTWQATATVSWKGAGEKSILLDKVADDGGLWDLCNLLTFLTGRNVATAEYCERVRPDGYGDYAVAQIETLRAAALAWQNRESLVSKNLHFALLLYNQAMNTNILQLRAASYYTALDIVLGQHEHEMEEYKKASKNIRKKLKREISGVLKQTKGLEPDQVERYKNLLPDWINRGPTSLDKLFSLLQSLGIIDPSPTHEQEMRVRHINQVRNRLIHAGQTPKLEELKGLEGLDDEQAKRYTFNIVAAVVPEIIRIVIGYHLGFRAGGLGSYCQIKDDTINFFQNGVFRGESFGDSIKFFENGALGGPRFTEVFEQILKKNSELYKRLS